MSNGNEYLLRITQYWNGTSDSVTQYSESAFITRATPTLTIDSFTTPVATVTKTFTATYAQAQGDSIKTVKWTLVNNTTGNTVDDTGTIDTQILSYDFDGFLTGNNYTLSLTIETENGVIVTDSKTFNVTYAENTGVGSIDLKCTDDNGVLLSWTPPVNIPGVCNPSGAYSITNKVLTLNSGATITWDTVDGEAMDFPDTYSAAWKGENIPAVLSTVTPTGLQPELNDIFFCADGSLAVAVANGMGYIYSVSGTTFTGIVNNGFSADVEYCHCFVQSDTHNTILIFLMQIY